MDIKELISKMTLEQKALLTSGKDFWQTANIDELGIPSIFLSDGPHGIRKQAAAADHLGLNASIPATCFPTAATMASSWNDELGEEMGKALGEEAVAQKVNVLLGPGLNMKRNPRCGRNFEYFSEDPFLAGKMAASYVRGIQSNGISACLKHFACNNQEEKRMTLDTIVDERTLREIYLTGFELGVKEGKTKTIMSSYNMLNGTHTNENEHLNEILRKDWGYNGVVVTDWGGENDRVLGLKVGNELEMPGAGGDTCKDIINAVKEGKLDEKVLDEAIERLLTLVFTTEEVYQGDKKEFDVEAHHKLAQKCAEECQILLKNEGNVLPLAKGTKVAIVGDFAKNARYQGAGSSIVNPTKLDNTLDVIKEYADIDFVGYEQGFDRYGKMKKGLIKKACALAGKADVVLVYLGLDEVTEAEGLDRASMKMEENQFALLKALKETGKKIVGVLSCGSSVEMPWADSCDAILHAYLSGQAGARATLNILTGVVNPSGRLAESYPFNYEDCSSAKRFPGKEKTIEYREGLFIGYRYYDTVNKEVRYPFGFGLSYTTFEYSDLVVNNDGVTFKLKNTGTVAGSEVAQLYVGAKDSKIIRPRRELKGFKKVHLEPGEEKEVHIPFDEYTFRYWNVKTNKWEIEGCTYNIMVSSNINDVRLQNELTLEGTTDVLPYDEKELPSYFKGDVQDVDDEEFAKLLGHDIPNPNYSFYKKNRMLVHYNTTVFELKYAPGWAGRFFSGVIKFAIKLLRAFGNKAMANTLIMGMLHQPMRGISRMTGGMISWGQLDGMILMFNGHFFKGLHHFFKMGRVKSKEAKEKKKLEKAKKEAK
ncbi:MAG: glycoside hydrolase family 3 C-terminal domain-containing protein [Bacillales bacterium]|nr:glycoside hydrolase family 3 C-terminal domain-containing protein [Bacillales bacterium]